MTSKRKTYQERAERLVKTIGIAEKIVRSSKSLDDVTKNYFTNWGQEIKGMALNPEPQFKKVSSIKYLENDFLIYWNESAGPDVEKFWTELYKNGIDFERKDIIQSVLKRKKIKNIYEYDNVIDNIVIAEQRGKINKEQVVELNKLIRVFEVRQSNKGEKKTR